MVTRFYMIVVAVNLLLGAALVFTSQSARRMTSASALAWVGGAASPGCDSTRVNSNDPCNIEPGCSGRQKCFEDQNGNGNVCRDAEDAQGNIILQCAGVSCHSDENGFPADYVTTCQRP